MFRYTYIGSIWVFAHLPLLISPFVNVEEKIVLVNFPVFIEIWTEFISSIFKELRQHRLKKATHGSIILFSLLLHCTTKILLLLLVLLLLLLLLLSYYYIFILSCYYLLIPVTTYHKYHDKRQLSKPGSSKKVRNKSLPCWVL